mgnify:FL=1
MGSATLSLTIASDYKTEGPEELTLHVSDTTYKISINDTSKKIEGSSTIYFKGNGVAESFTQSAGQNFFQGKSYGYYDFYSVGRLEEWIGNNLKYDENSLYPISGTLSYVSASFDEGTSFLAANGYINISDLPKDYTLSNVFNRFVVEGPNQILGSDEVDIVAAFTDGDYVNGYSGADTFLLSSEKSTYRFYDLDVSTYSGKIDNSVTKTL